MLMYLLEKKSMMRYNDEVELWIIWDRMRRASIQSVGRLSFEVNCNKALGSRVFLYYAITYDTIT